MDSSTASHLSQAACRHLTQSSIWSSTRRIAGYLAFNSEADPLPAMIEATDRGREVLVPIIDGSRLYFAPWRPGIDLQTNQFGIAEPVHSPVDRVTTEHLDLVITPLVGFDPSGNRIGMGGGYYDRGFAWLNESPRPPRPVLIGFGYDLQRVEAIPAQSWDVPLDAVVTESGFHVTPGRQAVFSKPDSDD
jgi:5-formyltetrahydrofolate cyclo-ligase